MNVKTNDTPGAIDARFDDQLKAALGPTAFDAIRRRTRVEFDASTHTLTLFTPDAFSADHLDRLYREALRQAAAAALAGDLADATGTNTAAPSVHVRVVAAPGSFTAAVTAPDAIDASDAPVAATPALNAAPRSVAPPPKRPGFRHRLDEFVVGDANRLAFNAASLLAQLPDDAPSPLFLHGPCGVGKTHLLQALCKEALRQHPNARVRYTTGERFTNAFILAVQHRTLPDFRDRMRRLDLLVIDDVHFVADKDKTSSELYHCIDELADGGHKLAFASDAHPKQIQQFSDAMVSRCLTGLVAPVGPLDEPAMATLAHRLAQRDGLTLTDAAANRLAELSASARELSGWLVTVRALAKVNRLDPGTPIGHLLLDQAVDQQQAAAPPRRVTLKQLIDAAAQTVGVTPGQALAKSRKRELVLARDLAVHLAKELTSLSYPEIARGLNRPNHSTVITAHRRIQAQLPDDPELIIPAEPAPVKLSRLLQRTRTKAQAAASAAE